MADDGVIKIVQNVTDPDPKHVVTLTTEMIKEIVNLHAAQRRKDND